MSPAVFAQIEQHARAIHQLMCQENLIGGTASTCRFDGVTQDGRQVRHTIKVEGIEKTAARTEQAPPSFFVDVEGQARARFTTAEQAVKHAAKQVYACLDLQFSSQQLLEAGQVASWAYGFAGVTIYPPAKHGDAA